MNSKGIDPTHKEINEKIELLRKSIKSNNVEGVIECYHDFLNSFIKIGSYNKVTWTITWTRTIWDFAEELAKYTYASKLIHIAKEKLLIADLESKESLEFLALELEGALVDNINLIKDEALRCVNEYPYNIEFVQILAHTLINSKDKDDKFEGIHYYRKCIEEWGGSNNNLIGYVFNEELNIFKDTLNNSDYLNAEKQLDHIMSFSTYKKNPLSRNTMLIFKDRLSDRKHTEAVNKKTKREIKKVIKEEYENQSKKNIEQLGIFSAVITFIITAAASAFNSKQENTPLIIMAIGFILILFITTVSLLSERRKSFYSDYRFYLVIGYLVLSFYTVYEYKNILTIIGVS